MKLQLRPIFKDVFFTFAAQAAVVVIFFFIYRLIARNFGSEGVGEYSLVKRAIAFLEPPLLFGFAVGLPRYISMSRDRQQRSGYIKAGGLVIVIATVMFLLLMKLFRDYFAGIFFGSREHSNLLLPFSFLLAGLIWHAFVYSCLRGGLFVKTFNLFQVINLAVVPLVILVLFQDITIERAIGLIGITTFAIALIFSLFFLKEFTLRITKLQFRHSLKELLRYGLPRVPGHFALAGFFSLGPILAAHFASTREVGFLAVSQGLLNAAGTAVGPLSIILLTKVSFLVAQERQDAIKENVNFLMGAVFQCSIFVCVQLFIFADAVLKYWLGFEFYDAAPVMRIVLASIVFYAIYVTMRNVLNAAVVKPLEAINLFVSLAVFITIGGTLLFLVKSLSSVTSLSIAFSLAVVSLGILTYAAIRRIYPEKIKKDFHYIWTAVLINIILGLAATFAKSYVTSNLLYLIFFELLIGIIYLSVLWLLKMEWIRHAPKMIGTI